MTTSTAMQDLAIELPTGDAAVLMPERAMLLPGHRVLLIADTHFGKSEAMRRKGVPMPAGPRRDSFDRLRTAVDRAMPARVIVLGDLLHAPAAVTDALLDELCRMIQQLSAPIQLVPGNHDVKRSKRPLAELCGAAGIDVLEPCVRLGEVELVHEAAGNSARYAIGGHEHPAAVLRAGGDAIKLPAAVVGQTRTVLPAFSPLAPGGRAETRTGDRLFGFTARRVIELPG
ncbi:MAG: metallophosphoesterase [Planctomycetota bacterium]